MDLLNLEPPVFGLDINNLSIKVLKLIKKGSFFSIESTNTVLLKPGTVVAGAIKDREALVEAIKKVCNSVRGKRLKTKYVIASLPEEKSFMQVIQMPKMTPEEMESAITFEVENYLPMPVSDVYLDFEIVGTAKNDSQNLDVLIVATPKVIVDEYVLCLNKAGLLPLALEVESQAIVRTLISKENNPLPWAIVDFGGNITDFIVVLSGLIRFTCSIPVSSHQITDAMSSELKIDIAEAEKLKTKFDLSSKDSDSNRTLLIMAPILKNLSEEIKRYIDFYAEQNSGLNIEKVILCGGGANSQSLGLLCAIKQNDKSPSSTIKRNTLIG
ncbi:MAG: type IV pilus assembly protein PilM [Candidatus Staskawiczbacteria bacterium]|nr:type IV pilus assembly protein PilM [Candidatus Staskawiczbacteria bacterium]